jgi:hypothetical protein
VASNWGQHITLASNGAKIDQQSVDVVLIKLWAAVKFNVHCPTKRWHHYIYNKIGPFNSNATKNKYWPD